MVAPDDRRAPREPWDVHLSNAVLCGTPGLGKVWAVRDDPTRQPSETWPVFGCGTVECRGSQREAGHNEVAGD